MQAAALYMLATDEGVSRALLPGGYCQSGASGRFGCTRCRSAFYSLQSTILFSLFCVAVSFRNRTFNIFLSAYWQG